MAVVSTVCTQTQRHRTSKVTEKTNGMRIFAVKNVCVDIGEAAHEQRNCWRFARKMNAFWCSRMHTYMCTSQKRAMRRMIETCLRQRHRFVTVALLSVCNTISFGLFALLSHSIPFTRTHGQYIVASVTTDASEMQQQVINALCAHQFLFERNVSVSFQLTTQ